jgi:hypothetical protein
MIRLRKIAPAPRLTDLIMGSYCSLFLSWQLGIAHAAQSHDTNAIREYERAVKLKPSLSRPAVDWLSAYARTGQRRPPSAS